MVKKHQQNGMYPGSSNNTGIHKMQKMCLYMLAKHENCIAKGKRSKHKVSAGATKRQQNAVDSAWVGVRAKCHVFTQQDAMALLIFKCRKMCVITAAITSIVCLSLGSNIAIRGISMHLVASISQLCTM